MRMRRQVSAHLYRPWDLWFRCTNIRLPWPCQHSKYWKECCVIAVGWKDFDHVSKESPCTSKRTGLYKAAIFLNCLPIWRSLSSQGNWKCNWSQICSMMAVQSWSETQNVKENTSQYKNEREKETMKMRDAARRMNKSIDVTCHKYSIFFFWWWAIHAKHGTIYIYLYTLTATNFSDPRIEVHFVAPTPSLWRIFGWNLSQMTK